MNGIKRRMNVCSECVNPNWECHMNDVQVGKIKS